MDAGYAETQLGELRGPDYQVVIIADNDDGRMFPLTEETPKCLLPIANRPLLCYQLDLLKRYKAAEIFIVVSEEHVAVVSAFLATYNREDIDTNLELISVSRMMGSADGLRAVNDRIRGDFIVITSDVVTDCSIGALVNLHRLRTSDVTIAVANSMEEEPDRKGGSKKFIDEEDQEYVGVDSDGRLVFKSSALELEGSVQLSKPLLHRCKKLSLRKDVSDTGIYVMSWWVLEFIMRSPRLSSIRSDVVPYLTRWQFQPEGPLLAHIPGLEHRKRPLAVLEGWLNAATSRTATRNVAELSEHMIRPSTIMPSMQSMMSIDSSLLNSSAMAPELNTNVDMLRLYSMLIETTSTGPIASPDTYSATMSAAVCKRVTNLRSYMNINRDLPQLFLGSLSLPWPRMQGYSKKEMSVIGEKSEMGDKVTMKQCCVGASVKVGQKTKLNSCIVMDRVVIGERLVFRPTCDMLSAKYLICMLSLLQLYNSELNYMCRCRDRERM